MKSKLESRIDTEFERIGVKPYVYHIRVLYPGRYRRSLRLFEGITIATDSPQKASDVNLTVFGLDDISSDCKEFKIVAEGQDGNRFKKK